MAVAVAGRRVDAEDAKTRSFPLSNVEMVRERIRDRLRELQPSVVVASAAAGVDLLALDEALHLGAEIVVVLPFEKSTFEESSVGDRPGPWRDLFKAIYPAARVMTIDRTFDNDTDAYTAATHRIIAVAHDLGGKDGTVAFAVWDGRSRGSRDHTEEFIQSAKDHDLRVIEESTL